VTDALRRAFLLRPSVAIADIGLNAGTAPPIGCPPETDVSVIAFHGTDDPVAAYEGGEQTIGDAVITLPTVEEAIRGWARLAGGNEEPRVEGNGRCLPRVALIRSQAESAGQVTLKHSIRIDAASDLPPVVEPGVGTVQQFRTHPAVLGEIEPAAGFRDPLVEAVKQR
jgi:hypothetical protein